MNAIYIDYLRVTDLSHVPDEIVSLYDDDTAERGEVVFAPQGAA
jgi:hypothetical protein